MSDKKNRAMKFFAEPSCGLPQLPCRQLIDTRERFIHQHQLGFDRQSSRKPYALPLSSRKIERKLASVFSKANQIQIPLHSLLPFASVDTGPLQGQLEIITNGFPWKQSRALKHITNERTALQMNSVLCKCQFTSV